MAIRMYVEPTYSHNLLLHWQRIFGVMLPDISSMRVTLGRHLRYIRIWCKDVALVLIMILEF